MRLVRCEQCGAKALFAASQCPRCTHPLALRDSRGEAAPLAHCRECDTYYPRSRGGCKWCGTKAAPTSASRIPVIAGVAAAVALVALVAWQYWGRPAGSGAGDPGGASAEVAAAPSALVVELPPVTALIDTAAERPVVTGADSLVAAPAVSTATPPSAVPAVLPPSTGLVPSASAATTSRPASPAAPSPAERYSGPWTAAIAEQWVNVRGSASREAMVVGVVTPKSRVQLGELRAGWRRVRAPGLEGWADARFFSADSSRR